MLQSVTLGFRNVSVIMVATVLLEIYIFNSLNHARWRYYGEHYASVTEVEHATWSLKIQLSLKCHFVLSPSSFAGLMFNEETATTFGRCCYIFKAIFADREYTEC